MSESFETILTNIGVSLTLSTAFTFWFIHNCLKLVSLLIITILQYMYDSKPVYELVGISLAIGIAVLIVLILNEFDTYFEKTFPKSKQINN